MGDKSVDALREELRARVGPVLPFIWILQAVEALEDHIVGLLGPQTPGIQRGPALEALEAAQDHLAELQGRIPPHIFEGLVGALAQAKSDLAYGCSTGPLHEALHRQVKELRRLLDSIPEVAAADKRERPPDNARMSAKDLADHFGIPYERLRKRLERWRGKHPDAFGKDWFEVPDPGLRRDRYLYRFGAVTSLVLDPD